MTLNSNWLAQFASTVAATTGGAVAMAGLTRDMTGSGGAELLIYGGGAAVIAGFAAFVVFARRLHDGKRRLPASLAAFVLGLACTWFWLVPGKGAFLTVACESGHFGACSSAVAFGGLPASLAENDDEFVKHRCMTARDAKYCRTAAAKKLLEPAAFCPRIDPHDSFEVVEWCTLNAKTRRVVARR